MLPKIEAMRKRHGNPINASVVALLAASLRRLAKQLRDGVRVEDPYGSPEERAECLLTDLLDATYDVAIAAEDYLGPQEETD